MNASSSISPEDIDELDKAATIIRRIVDRYKNPKAKVLPPNLRPEVLTIAEAVHERGDQVTELEFDQMYMTAYSRKDTLGKGGIFKGDTFSALSNGQVALTRKGYDLVQLYGEQFKKEAAKLLANITRT